MALKPFAIAFWDTKKQLFTVERIAYRPHSEGYKLPLGEVWDRLSYACKKIAITEKSKDKDHYKKV